MRTPRDLSGQVFGRLRAIALTGESLKMGNSTDRLWRCQCNCGKECVVRQSYLVYKNDQHCGCVARKRPNFKDLTGKRFGRLVVLSKERVQGKAGARWKCHCDCGKDVEVRGSSLRNGQTKSCGCRNGTLLKPGGHFGHLTVIRDAKPDDKPHWKSHTRGKLHVLGCVCGKELVLPGSMVAAGAVGSCGCVAALEAEESGCREVMSAYRYSARRRKLAFELSDADMRTLFQGKCHYCHAEPTNCNRSRELRKKTKRASKAFKYNGIERLDPNRGYIAGNVVPACWNCNRAKGKLTAQEFLAWIERVHNHQNEKNETAVIAA